MKRKLFWLAAAAAVGLLSLFLSQDYLHVPLVFFPFFFVWSWQGRQSDACRRRPEYGTCAPQKLTSDEDARG